MAKTLNITTVAGIELTVSIVQPGEGYGLTKKLRAAHPMVEFHKGGYFITRYYAKTLLGSNAGLMLDGANPDLNIDAATMDKVRAFVAA